MKKEPIIQKETLTEKSRTNPWMIATLVLGIMCVVFLASNYVNLGNNEVNNQTLLKELCSKVTSIPSWANKDGEIINSGYIPFGNQSKEFIDGMILEEIHFIYHPDCGYCAQQIKDFGEDWQRYLESGLAVDCSNVQ